MRYQIHCLVSKNDAVIIVIEDDCHATMFQCRSAQERFAHVHHVKCDLDQDSFSTVRHHVPVHHFLSVVLQCATLFAATTSTFAELSIGNCGANQGGQTCPKHPESIINSCSSVSRFSVRLGQLTVYRRFLLSSSENIQSPSSAHPMVFT